VRVQFGSGIEELSWWQGFVRTGLGGWRSPSLRSPRRRSRKAKPSFRDSYAPAPTEPHFRAPRSRWRRGHAVKLVRFLPTAKAGLLFGEFRQGTTSSPG